MFQGKVLVSYSTVHFYSLLPLFIQVTHWEHCSLFQELPDHIYSDSYAFAPGSCWLQPQSDVQTTEQLPLEQLGLRASTSRHLSGVNVGGECSAFTFCTKIYPAGSGAEPVIQTSSTFNTNAHRTCWRPLRLTNKVTKYFFDVSSESGKSISACEANKVSWRGWLICHALCKKRGMIKINK